MDLFIKCAAAVLIMVFIHFISKTPNYYISALALSFPGLSMVAYYFMYVEHGAEKVQDTTLFGLLSAAAFMIFLAALHLALRRFDIVPSLLISGGIWAVAALAAILIWNQWK